MRPPTHRCARAALLMAESEPESHREWASDPFGQRARRSKWVWSRAPGPQFLRGQWSTSVGLLRGQWSTSVGLLNHTPIADAQLERGAPARTPMVRFAASQYANKNNTSLVIMHEYTHRHVHVTSLDLT